MKPIKIYPIMITDYKRRDDRKFVGGVYLHGEAADKTDLFETDIETLEEILELKDGIYDVTIIREDKIEQDAVMYFWVIPGLRYGEKNLRGLVCLKTDTEAIKDAKTKFEERRVWL